jgi:CPA1 family monovalent cation:H+ antiporter
VSLVAPYAAYLAGEAVGASGVLAVVTAGLLLGFRSPTDQPAIVRLTEDATWAALRFVLEGAVFALIGLQLRHLFTDPSNRPEHLVVVVGSVLLTVVVVRPLWIGLVGAGQRLLPSREPAVGWREGAAMSWAGMRGVVSLAAAQTLPLDTPFRSLLILCTVAVILVTLIAQGLSLPWVIRRLGISVDAERDVHDQRTAASRAAADRILAVVEERRRSGELTDARAERMRSFVTATDWRNWDEQDSARFGPPRAAAMDWRRELVDVQRSVFLDMRNAGTLSEDVLRELQFELDLQEALLERQVEPLTGHLPELPEGLDDSRPARPDGPPPGPTGAAPGPAPGSGPA